MPIFGQNLIGYLKNHWTKHRLVCTHSNAFFMTIPNMFKTFNDSEFLKKIIRISEKFDVPVCHLHSPLTSEALVAY